MLSYLKKASVLAVGALVLILLPFAHQGKASSFDQRTVVTFSGAVAIPGQVLPAGTYVFKAPLLNAREVVQIFNADETRLISTQLTIPVYLQKAPDHSMVILGESPAGKPPVVHEYVYAGVGYGHEFVYRH